MKDNFETLCLKKTVHGNIRICKHYQYMTLFSNLLQSFEGNIRIDKYRLPLLTQFRQNSHFQ